jgi:hypothetical protein
MESFVKPDINANGLVFRKGKYLEISLCLNFAIQLDFYLKIERMIDYMDLRKKAKLKGFDLSNLTDLELENKLVVKVGYYRIYNGVLTSKIFNLYNKGPDLFNPKGNIVDSSEEISGMSTMDSEIYEGFREGFDDSKGYTYFNVIGYWLVLDLNSEQNIVFEQIKLNETQVFSIQEAMEEYLKKSLELNDDYSKIFNYFNLILSDSMNRYFMYTVKRDLRFDKGLLPGVIVEEEIYSDSDEYWEAGNYADP